MMQALNSWRSITKLVLLLSKFIQIFFELIALGTLHSQAQDSHLNIAIGPLVQTWRIGFSDARRPQQGEIDQALAKIDPHQIQLDPENHTVFLMRPGMKIDLGSLG